mmetsp:Transcript_27237/g.82711  ORF Transcript_27237/g.82711 Transcript_27237/m.82711 type:complete len:147 (-) Transcript_27237:596-1036(-)
MSWNCDDSARNGLAEEGLGIRLQLFEDHCRDLFRSKSTRSIAPRFRVQIYQRLARRAFHHLTRQMLDVRLHGGVAKCAADEAFGVIDCIGGVASCLILGSVPNQPCALFLGERNPRSSRIAAIGIGNHFYPPRTRPDHGHGRVRGA